MEKQNYHEGQKFASPEEELLYLKERIAKKEHELELKKEKQPREKAVKEVFKEYKRQAPEKVLAENYKLEEKEAKAVALDLNPEKHDEQMASLLGILQQKGLMNVLSVVKKMNNPHIEDDFERFLV